MHKIKAACITLHFDKQATINILGITTTKLLGDTYLFFPTQNMLKTTDSTLQEVSCTNYSWEPHETEKALLKPPPTMFPITSMQSVMIACLPLWGLHSLRQTTFENRNWKLHQVLLRQLERLPVFQSQNPFPLTALAAVHACFSILPTPLSICSLLPSECHSSEMYHCGNCDAECPFLKDRVYN